MAIETRISSFLNKRKGIIPFLFALMCTLFVACLVGVEVRQLKFMDHFLTFNTGAELAAMFAGIMIIVSILPSYKRQSGYTRVFVSLVALLTFLMACDIGEALVDGIPELAKLNKLFPAFVWANETAAWFFFFVYSTHVLKSEGKAISVFYIIGLVTLVAFIAIPFVTLKDPLYYYIDDFGFYHRKLTEYGYTFYISRFPSVIFSILTIICIFLSKARKRSKVLIGLFIGLPLIAMASGGYKTGVAIQYITMMMSVILIFAIIFADNEKDLYSTSKELGIATNIQKHMLPTIFPAFPDRKDIDLYASMTPAKEVGGDFYDYFLIDDNHLALVMADVSDKGVPAALFMMASKIILQNIAMLGKSPGEVLTLVNNQICSNNQDDMFITIWLGIIDLRTGILTASNAGHEKPYITDKDGKFVLYEDMRNFVVGWNKDIKYNEYSLKLEKGSKIFVYTDGVPDATSNNGRLGFDKVTEILNKYVKEDPQKIIESVKKEIDDFVGHTDQFDDMTMLCFEYKGQENE